MFLVYRPTGDAVFLGKRMGDGWYGTPEDVAERIASLFSKAEECQGQYSMDDFAIAMEQGDNQPNVISKWKYTDDDNVLMIDESVPYGKYEGI